MLEPTAGNGSLLRPIMSAPYGCTQVVACELDTTHIPALRALALGQAPRPTLTIHVGDFLTAPTDLLGRFDLAMCNTPFENGQTEAFVDRVLDVCERAIVLAQNSFMHSRRRRGFWATTEIRAVRYLESRPSFGVGASGSETGKRDFVVLELARWEADLDARLPCDYDWWP